MKASRLTLMTVALVAVLIACSDTAGPDNAGNVKVRFALASTQVSALGTMAATAVDLPLDGDNGDLTIDSIWLVVDEFELEQIEDACEEVEGEEDDDCEEFEVAPFLVSVPLEGESLGEVNAEVAPGTYEELKFETKAPDDDGDLLTDIRDNYIDDWPGEASMLVVGTFTPDGGDEVAFRAYFDAEVKVELEFPEDEPLVVAEGGDLTVTVFIDPAIWFVNDDGTVDDLSVYDYATAGEVFKFEAKFENGFTKIELDDD